MGLETSIVIYRGPANWFRRKISVCLVTEEKTSSFQFYFCENLLQDHCERFFSTSRMYFVGIKDGGYVKKIILRVWGM